MAMTLAQAQETLHLLGVPRLTEEEKLAEVATHFALSQLDLMEKIGHEVETARNKAKFADVIKDLKCFEELRTDCYEDYHDVYSMELQEDGHPKPPENEEHFPGFIKDMLGFPADPVISIFIHKPGCDFYNVANEMFG